MDYHSLAGEVFPDEVSPLLPQVVGAECGLAIGRR